MNDDGRTAEPSLLRSRPGYGQQSVLRVAVDVFNRQGYDATSMGDVAEILGISRSAIYHHVPSKGELLRLALDQALASLEEIPLQPEAITGPADERLRFVVRQFVAVLVDQMPSITLLMRLRGNTEIERAALSRRRAFEEEIVELVSIAQDDGSLCKDVDPGAAAYLLIGIVKSVVDWYDPRSSLTPPQLVDQIINLGFAGLKGGT